MSEYTTRQILDMIEENGGPEGLDLSGADLSAIDLNPVAIAAQLDRAQADLPVWYSRRTGGINLQGANLEGADLTDAKMRAGAV